jgi:carbon monoxide dehydrogenase subunit G
MRIEKDFYVPAPPAQAFELLIDLERVGPCIPGGEVGSRSEDGSHPAKIALKLGPMRMSYAGTVRIGEADETAGRAVLETELREARGQGTAKARMTMEIGAADSGSHVRTVTEVALSGRAAQMAQGVIDEVADRLVGEMATCLAACLEPVPGSPAPSTVGGGAPAPPPQAKPINGLRLLSRVYWVRLKRIFAKKRGEQSA